MNDTTASWRDFANELTAEQIARLDGAAWMGEADLFDAARDMTADNRLQDRYSHITDPAGATRIHRWCDDGEGTISREFIGREWPAGTTTIRVIGTQDSDGTITRKVEIRADEHTDPILNVTDAKTAAEAIVAACGELVRMDELDGPPFQ